MHSLEDFLQLDPVELSDSQKNMFVNVTGLSEELRKLNDEERDNLAAYIAPEMLLGGSVCIRR